MRDHGRVVEFKSVFDFAIGETSVNEHKLKFEIKVYYFSLLKWFKKGMGSGQQHDETQPPKK